MSTTITTNDNQPSQEKVLYRTDGIYVGASDHPAAIFFRDTPKQGSSVFWLHGTNWHRIAHADAIQPLLYVDQEGNFVFHGPSLQFCTAAGDSIILTEEERHATFFKFFHSTRAFAAAWYKRCSFRTSFPFMFVVFEDSVFVFEEDKKKKNFAKIPLNLQKQGGVYCTQFEFQDWKKNTKVSVTLYYFGIMALWVEKNGKTEVAEWLVVSNKEPIVREDPSLNKNLVLVK